MKPYIGSYVDSFALGFGPKGIQVLCYRVRTYLSVVYHVPTDPSLGKIYPFAQNILLKFLFIK